MKHRRHNGFTLVELLVAVSIFSVLIVTVYSCLMSGMSAKEKGENIVTLAETAHEIVRRLSVDLANSLVFSTVGFSGNPDEISFAALQASSDKAVPRICRVSYSKHMENEALLGTVRRGCQLLGIDCRETDVSGACIRQLEFSYAYGDSEERESGWSGFWISTERSPLPLAVRVRLVLESGDETMRIDKVILVPVSGGPEDDLASSI